MKLPEISGKFTMPKPWQIAIGVGLVVFVVVVWPAITHVMVGEKKKKETVQITTVGKIGEPWHPVAFPAALSSPPPRTAPPPLPTPIMTLQQIQPQTARQPQPLAANGGPKSSDKAPPDPEQDAISAPIVIAKAEGGTAAIPPAASPPSQAHGGSLQQQGQGEQGGMAGMLKPTETAGFMAERMKHPNMTVGEGRVIQCHSVTRMTSGLPGFVKAQISRDVWSEDDTTKLIERDSTIFGEIQHGMISGVDRMFVLWRRVETPRPNLVRITLNSPAADEMGEAGVTGDVDHHFWPKVKGALLLSGIESVFSGVSGALSNLGRGDNNQSQGLNLNFSQVGSQGSNLASQMLQSTIQIPDTLTVNQAAPCSIFVSGDLDFTDVYSIARKATR